MKRRLLALLPLFIITAGCNQAPESADPSVITSRSEAWETAFNASDIDALVDLYESDARILPPNGKMASGGDALRAEFGAMIDSGLSAELTSVEAMVSGNLAYNVGTYIMRAGDDVADAGKYMETWHRGDDGQWRYTNDMWSSDMPVAAVGAAAKAPETHLMISHEVEDADKWMAAWRGKDSRHKLFKDNGAIHVHTFRTADNPKLTGLVVAVSDMDALNAMLESEEGQAAAIEDGVNMDTITILTEVN
jgi:ketosteroid isomerase-like protein